MNNPKIFSNLIGLRSFGSKHFSNIEKSHIVNDFGHSLKLSKKGSLIKDKLNIVLEKEKQKLNTVETDLKVSLQNCDGCEPSVEADEWYTEGLEYKLTLIPKTFPWGEIYDQKIEAPIGSLSIGEENKIKSTTLGERKSKYNDLARKYLSIAKDIIQLNTMIANIEDNKNYDLTVKQASIIGF